MRIEVNNLTTNEIDEGFVKKAARKVLKGERKEENISIAFIGQGRMRKLNKKYRSKNKVTDVLSFSQGKLPFKKYSQELQKTEGLGEVVICLKEVKKQAKKFSVPFEQELSRILIHGVLHLLGYDHERSAEEAKKMEEKEKEYLGQIVKLLNC